MSRRRKVPRRSSVIADRVDVEDLLSFKQDGVMTTLFELLDSEGFDFEPPSAKQREQEEDGQVSR